MGILQEGRKCSEILSDFHWDEQFAALTESQVSDHQPRLLQMMDLPCKSSFYAGAKLHDCRQMLLYLADACG